MCLHSSGELSASASECSLPEVLSNLASTVRRRLAVLRGNKGAAGLSHTHFMWLHSINNTSNMAAHH